VNHDLGGANFHTLATADTLFLVDHVDAGLGILGNCLMLTSLHALAALDTDAGLSAAALGNNPDAGQIFVKFLIKCNGTCFNTLQACHALCIFLNSELLHTRTLLLCIFSLSIIHLLSGNFNTCIDK
jgi:hypothetical protein